MPIEIDHEIYTPGAFTKEIEVEAIEDEKIVGLLDQSNHPLVLAAARILEITHTDSLFHALLG